MNIFRNGTTLRIEFEGKVHWRKLIRRIGKLPMFKFNHEEHEYEYDVWGDTL